jgi:hypothetical protein
MNNDLSSDEKKKKGENKRSHRHQGPPFYSHVQPASNAISNLQLQSQAQLISNTLNQQVSNSLSPDPTMELIVMLLLLLMVNQPRQRQGNNAAINLHSMSIESIVRQLLAQQAHAINLSHIRAMIQQILSR